MQVDLGDVGATRSGTEGEIGNEATNLIATGNAVRVPVAGLRLDGVLVLPEVGLVQRVAQ